MDSLTVEVLDKKVTFSGNGMESSIKVFRKRRLS
ncbi:hypothetical protein J2T18_001738 [Paenibacillus polymyxa]|nr:hypothetical protein [Paenibacillus polymyxa]